MNILTLNCCCGSGFSLNLSAENHETVARAVARAVALGNQWRETHAPCLRAWRKGAQGKQTPADTGPLSNIPAPDWQRVQWTQTHTGWEAIIQDKHYKIFCPRHEGDSYSLACDGVWLSHSINGKGCAIRDDARRLAYEDAHDKPGEPKFTPPLAWRYAPMENRDARYQAGPYTVRPLLVRSVNASPVEEWHAWGAYGWLSSHPTRAQAFAACEDHAAAQS